MDLKGQRVVVLGGSSGLGLAAAQQAAKAGALVTIASSRQSSVDRALAQLPAEATGKAVDTTDEAQVTELFSHIGTIDHLVYTAGEHLALMKIETLDIDAARKFFEVRYFGAVTAVKAALPHMRRDGSITLTAGGAKDRPGPGWAIAASVLGSMDALTRALAVELAPIRVNIVSPGVIRAPLWDDMTEADREALYENVGKAALNGRVGEPEDVALAYLYCMTQKHATGTTLTLDGGSFLV
jgi:NAD(P)-dependent dehydrogenase (short-subunit alcohol dehydrogenase family)